jgi:hypothetical protein
MPAHLLLMLSVSIALLFPLASHAAGKYDSTDWIIERSDQTRPLGDARSVEILNPFGDVRTRKAADGNISIFAVAQRHRNDPERPRLHFEERGRHLVIHVEYPLQSAQTPRSEGTVKRRIDLAAFVPAEVSLRIETIAGRAETKGHKGAVEIETRTGEIVISTQGTVSARSERGSVQATFKNRRWTGSSRFETVTGNITIYLMEHADVRAEISTAGNITTDYSIDITSFPGGSRKQAQARIGAATHTLQALSANGAIRLARIFGMIPAPASHHRSESHNKSVPESRESSN